MGGGDCGCSFSFSGVEFQGATRVRDELTVIGCVDLRSEKGGSEVEYTWSTAKPFSASSMTEDGEDIVK